MNLLEIINIKNEFHILILKAKEKAKSKEQLKNLSVLTETLELLHILHKKIDEVLKEYINNNFYLTDLTCCDDECVC